MADDDLGEHASLLARLSISSSEAEGSQGTSSSSQGLSTSSSLNSDDSQAVSRCFESIVQQ
eukprot:11206364-Ditylum_brightwellii.AAC.1